MFPKIRSGHAIVHLERGQSVIGSMTFGLGHIVKDPHGALLALNNILDGSRAFETAVEEIASVTDTSYESAFRFLEDLVENGHIEDVSAQTTLSEAEQQRFSRGAHFYSWISKHAETNRWRPQELLREAHVTVLGVGGIGGVIASHLVAAGVGSIHLVDADVVELSNLNRQYLFGMSSIGQRKVDAAAQRLNELNPQCDVTVTHKRIAGMADVANLMTKTNLVFKAADSPDDIPYWVSDAALSVRTPWIDCSYTGPIVNCCIYAPGISGCYRCMRDSERSRLAEEGRAGAISETPPEFNAALGPVVHIAGSLAAYEGIRFLTGLTPRSVGQALHQNTFDYRNSYIVPVPGNCPHDLHRATASA